MESRPLLLSAGRSGRLLRDLVAEKLQKYFDIVYNYDFIGRVTAKDFNNGEIFAKLEDDHRGRAIHVIQGFYDPETDDLIQKLRDSDIDKETKISAIRRMLTINRDVMELLILGDSIKRAGGKDVHVYIPHFPYSRQDKKDDGRVPISAKLVVDLIEKAFGRNLQKMGTIDMHADQEQGFPDMPFDNLRMVAAYALYMKSHYDLDNVTVVSADVGGVTRARQLAELLKVPLAIIDKRRHAHGEAKAEHVIGDVKGRKTVLYDDMGDTLGSVVTANRMLVEAGAKEEMLALLVHGIYSNSVDKNTGEIRFAEDRIRDAGIKVVTTNSIPRSESYYRRNADIMPHLIDVSYPLAENVLCNHREQSLSRKITALEELVKNSDIPPEEVAKYVIEIKK